MEGEGVEAEGVEAEGVEAQGVEYQHYSPWRISSVTLGAVQCLIALIFEAQDFCFMVQFHTVLYCIKKYII